MPIFTFLVLRWLWRMLIWSRFLRHVSHSDLRLVPTHPDGAGGLAFLGTFQRAFGVVLIPLAASVAARGVQWVQFGGGTIESLRNAVIAFGVIALLVSLGPLLLFAPKLFAVRRRGLLEYARLATDYTRDFDRRWLREGPSPEQALLGTSDIQSLAEHERAGIRERGREPFDSRYRGAACSGQAPRARELTPNPYSPVTYHVSPITRDEREGWLHWCVKGERIEIPGNVSLYCPLVDAKGTAAILVAVDPHGYYQLDVLIKGNRHTMFVSIGQAALCFTDPEPEREDAFEIER